jgi:hypothetical protein
MNKEIISQKTLKAMHDGDEKDFRIMHGLTYYQPLRLAYLGFDWWTEEFISYLKNQIQTQI